MNFPNGREPCFIEILIDNNSATIRIPQFFVHNFKQILPEHALLETGTGDPWVVKLEQVGDTYCFTQGWLKFVKDHQLEMADLLAFWFDGHSTFQVSVYGKHCCEKEFVNSSHSVSNVADIIQDEPPSDNSKGFSCTVKGGNGSTVARKSANFMEEETRMYFEVVLQPHHRTRMMIPIGFAKKTGILGNSSLELVNHKGQSWSVILVHRWNGARVCEIARGWTDFRKANKLAFGVTCIFEFDQNAKNVKVKVKEGIPCLKEEGRGRVAANQMEEEAPGETLTDFSMRRRSKRTRSLPGSETLPVCEPAQEKPMKTQAIVASPSMKQGLKRKCDEVTGKFLEHVKMRCGPTTVGKKSSKTRARTSNSKLLSWTDFMQASYISDRFTMCLPVTFAKELSERKHFDLVLCVSGGKTWTVQCIVGRRNATFQWKDFAQSNGLKMGDVCVFEQTNKTKCPSLNVIIFRSTA